MQLAALRHRPESEDCFLYTPDELRLRLHTAKADVQAVTVLYGDPYVTAPNPTTGEPEFAYQEAAMIKTGTGQTSDYWTISLTAPYHRLQYQFLVTGQDGNTVLLGDRGLRADSAANRRADLFRVPYFHAIDTVQTPAWVKETGTRRTTPRAPSLGVRRITRAVRITTVATCKGCWTTWLTCRRSA